MLVFSTCRIKVSNTGSCLTRFPKTNLSSIGSRRDSDILVQKYNTADNDASWIPKRWEIFYLHFLQLEKFCVFQIFQFTNFQNLIGKKRQGWTRYVLVEAEQILTSCFFAGTRLGFTRKVSLCFNWLPGRSGNCALVTIVHKMSATELFVLFACVIDFIAHFSSDSTMVESGSGSERICWFTHTMRVVLIGSLGFRFPGCLTQSSKTDE